MNITSLNLGALRQRLEETIAWYRSKAPIANPESSLRTDALAPPEDLARPNKKA
jgi:hypothetical protein